MNSGTYDKSGRCGYDKKRLMCKCCRCKNRCEKPVLHYLKETTWSVRVSNTGYTEVKCVQINQKIVLEKLIKSGVKIFPVNDDLSNNGQSVTKCN